MRQCQGAPGSERGHERAAPASGQHPQTASHDEARAELRKAYAYVQWLEKENAELEDDKAEYKRERDKAKKERDKYKDRLEDYEDD